MIERHMAYCAALDRVVHVYVRPVTCDEKDPANLEMPGIVCVEHSEECQGILCPLFDLPTDASMQRYEWFSRRQ
jgi:hypothetical protein